MYASRTTQLIVGIFGLVGIAALSVLAFTLGRIPLLAPPHYDLYAMFDNVSGLKTNDAVQIAGVKVGKVGAITLSQKNYRAKVTFQINQGVMVDDDAIASIKTNGIIGDKYVSIALGAGEPLKDGGVILHTESSFVIEDLIGQFVSSGKSAAAGEASPAASPSAAERKSGAAIAPPAGVSDSKKPKP